MYLLNAKLNLGGCIVPCTDYDNEYFTLTLKEKKGSIKATLKAKKAITMQSLELTTERVFDQNDLFFANGYQSWSTTKEYARYEKTNDLMPISNIGKFARFCTGAMSDYSFGLTEYGKTGIFHSYTYTYFRKKCDRKITLYGSKSERKGYTIFKVDMNKNIFSIVKDVEGLMLKKDEEYDLFDIAVIEAEYNKAFDKYFFDFMGLEKPRIQHLAGYTSWYNYFANINEEILLRDLAGIGRAKECTDIFQIDDGYQTATGDWLSIDKKKFPHGVKYIADKIHKEGYKAGIWLAPFCVQLTSKIVREHPDWLIKDEKGRNFFVHLGWGGSYALDIYNPEVREYLKTVFHTILNEWGFDMVKLDFLYTECIKPRNGKTRGEIMCDGVDLLREVCGDKLILGCGVPLGACMGIFDACRIGCDVNPVFEGDFPNKIKVNNEIPSAQNSMKNAIFRSHLDGRAFCNDPDVFFLRDINLKFTWPQKLLLGKINAICGNVLFVSDNAEWYTDNELKYLKEFFENKEYEILSAEQLDEEVIELIYKENSEEKNLTFNLNTGESTIFDCI